MLVPLVVAEVAVLPVLAVLVELAVLAVATHAIRLVGAGRLVGCGEGS